MSSFDPERIIAVDLRPQSLGFVVFEGGDSILDWGVKSFRGGVNATRIPLGPKVRELIATYVPDAFVLRKRKGTDAVLGELEQAARPRRVTVRFLTRGAIKDAFPGCRNKDEIASAVSDRFIELLSILPPKRKNWRREDYRMRIFDAAATGIAYFMKHQESPATISPR
jgi:hypothetical protein